MITAGIIYVATKTQVRLWGCSSTDLHLTANCNIFFDGDGRGLLPLFRWQQEVSGRMRWTEIIGTDLIWVIQMYQLLEFTTPPTAASF